MNVDRVEPQRSHAAKLTTGRSSWHRSSDLRPPRPRLVPAGAGRACCCWPARRGPVRAEPVRHGRRRQRLAAGQLQPQLPHPAARGGPACSCSWSRSLIVLLYFLKLKRKPLQVPSTFLWQQEHRGPARQQPLPVAARQRPAAAATADRAAADLRGPGASSFHGSTADGKHYILMIDNSASMAATDVAPSRLDVGQAGGAQGDRRRRPTTTSAWSSCSTPRPTILQSYTSDRGLLREAVERHRADAAADAHRGGPALADSLANPPARPRTWPSRPTSEDPAKERTYVAAEGIPPRSTCSPTAASRSPSPRWRTSTRCRGQHVGLGNLHLHFQLGRQAGAGARRQRRHRRPQRVRAGRAGRRQATGVVTAASARPGAQLPAASRGR